jgi:hypothetical protein
MTCFLYEINSIHEYDINTILQFDSNCTVQYQLIESTKKDNKRQAIYSISIIGVLKDVINAKKLILQRNPSNVPTI